jgi:hypothetical protein
MMEYATNSSTGTARQSNCRLTQLAGYLLYHSRCVHAQLALCNLKYKVTGLLQVARSDPRHWTELFRLSSGR